MGGVIGKHSLFRSSSKQSVKSNASSQNNLKSDVDGAPDVLGIKNSSIQVQPHEANGQGGSGSAGQHRDLEQQASQCDGSPAEWRSEAGLNEVEDKGQMPSGELRVLPEEQAKYLRAQFEAVSAPLASLDFLQLQKFQARLIRRQGEKLPLSQKNLFSKGKHTEKEIREMAKLTAVQVFKSSGLWNEDADAPRSSASINFEQYLASALHAKMKTESVQSVEFSAGHDAAKHGILKKAATQAVLLPEEIHPKRVRRLSFPDSLSLEEIEEEWEAKKQVSRRLGIEQGEGAALRGPHVNLDDMSNDDDDNASAMNEDNPDEGGVEAAAGANGASEGEDRDGSKPREAAASDNQQRHLTFRLVHGKSLTQEAFYDLTEGEILYKQEWRKSFRY